MNLLPHWVLTDKFPAFYDSESKTSIEQTARVYGAMQELIKEYNSFVDSVNQHILDFENAAKKDYEIFTTAIRQEFQDFIDVVTLKIQSQDSIIEDAVSYMKTNLSESIDAALLEMRANGSFSQEVLKVYADMENQIAVLNSRLNTFTALEEGSTTGDAELQDARTDYTGKTWDNVGEHIRGVTSELSSEIVLIEKALEKQTYSVMYWDTTIDNSGNILKYPSNAGSFSYFCSEKISCTKNDTLYVKDFVATSGYFSYVFLFKNNGAYVGRVDVSLIEVVDDRTKKYTIVDDCDYLIYSGHASQIGTTRICVNENYKHFAYDKKYIIDGMELTTVFNYGKVIDLPSGTYTTRTCEELQTLYLKGEGQNTIVKYNGSATFPMMRFNGATNVTIKDISFVMEHDSTIPNGIGTYVGLSFSNNCMNVVLDNLTMQGWNKAAVYITMTNGQTFTKNIKISNCNFDYNGYGLMLDKRAEYVQILNSSFGYSYTGVFNGGGNNMFSNCQFNSNFVGLELKGGDEYPNNSHASATGCQFNHNTNTAIYARADIGFMFSGCQIFYGYVNITDSVGTCFIGCEFGEVTIVDSGTTFNMFSNNLFQNNVTKQVTNEKCIFENNRDINGNLVA